MDKFGDIKQLVVRYHFWALCVFVAIGGMITWYLAYSGLDSEFTTNKSTIERGFTAGKAALSVTPHPNKDFFDGMDELIKLRRRDLQGAWEIMYGVQRKNILKWPPELGQELLNEVKRILGDLPIEQVEITPATEIPRRYRANYRNYIDEELKKLAAEIGAPWVGEEGAVAVAPQPGVGEGAVDPLSHFLVRWNTADQTRIKTSRFRWPADPEGIPDTRQLLYAQEDLWVLSALIKVIKRTNGDADAYHKCAIRGIEDILFGQDVGARTGKVTRLAVAAAELGPGQLPPPPPPVAPVGDGRGQMGQPGVKADDPANLRYVDLNYQPMTAEALATATKSGDTATAYLAVAKRMPIRLRLQMDTRKINKLLAECGNSELPIEIRQVRINCERGAAGGGPAIGPGVGVGREGPGMIGPPRIEGGRGPGAVAPQAQGGEQNQAFPYDSTVEIYGIVHIFNPVNAKKLGYSPEELAAMNTTPAGTATPATPAGPAPSVGTAPPMGTAPAGPAGTGPAPMAPMGSGPAPMPPAGGPAVPMPPAGGPVAPMPAGGPAPMVPAPVPPPAVPVPMPPANK